MLFFPPRLQIRKNAVRVWQHAHAVSISFRQDPAVLGEPVNPVRLLGTGRLSCTFHSGFAVLSAGNGASKKATAGLALFVLIDVMDCINFAQRTDITRGGLRVLYQLLSAASSLPKWCCCSSFWGHAPLGSWLVWVTWTSQALSAAVTTAGAVPANCRALGIDTLILL